MSWSINSTEVPSSTMRRSRCPSASLSAVSSPAAGSSMHTSARRGGERARDADQRALTVRQLPWPEVGQLGDADGLQRALDRRRRRQRAAGGRGRAAGCRALPVSDGGQVLARR